MSDSGVSNNLEDIHFQTTSSIIDQLCPNTPQLGSSARGIKPNSPSSLLNLINLEKKSPTCTSSTSTNFTTSTGVSSGFDCSIYEAKLIDNSKVSEASKEQTENRQSKTPSPVIVESKNERGSKTTATTTPKLVRRKSVEQLNEDVYQKAEINFLKPGKNFIFFYF